MEHEQGPRTEPVHDHPNEFEIEVSDLAGFSRAAPGASIPAPGVPQRGAARFAPRLRPQAVITSAVVVALLAILLGFYGGQVDSQLHTLLFPPPPPPLRLLPQDAGMRCMLDAAWSPDSARVALLGQQYDSICPDPSLNTRAGLVTVYDANSARLLATIHADDLTIPSIKAITNPKEADFTVSVALHYERVLWSPDGQGLAVTFWVDTGLIGTPQFLPEGDPAILDGVLFTDVNGTHPRVMTGQASAYGPYEVEWDLAAAHLIATPGVSYNLNGFGLLTPALAYRWQPDGSLAPTTAPLNTTTAPRTPPLGPIGSPDGASSFTMWQPGNVTAVTLQYAQADPPGPQRLPGVYLWQGDPLSAWSADGRYLLDGSVPAGLLVQAGTAQPSQDAIAPFALNAVWRLPLRDAGLAAILRAVDPNNQEGLAVAWRPDGKVVAAYTARGPDGTVNGIQPVTLYDCANGKVFTRLVPTAPQVAALNGNGSLLRWSPDGTHLLLFDTRIGTPLVWGLRNLA